MAGEALHSGGFYHGALSPEAVSAALDMISDLIKVVEEISPQYESLRLKTRAARGLSIIPEKIMAFTVAPWNY